MKKKVVSLMLVGAMIASLAACGGKDGGNSSNNASSTGESGDGYSTEIDMEEDPYTVAIQVVTLPGVEVPDEEAIEAAVNAITLDAINVNVDIQYVWISEVANTTSMAVAGNEKVDLIHVATVNPLSTMVGSDMLLDMNEGNLLQNRGTALTDLFGEELLASGEVGGRQLAVPAQVYNSAGKGIVYNKTVTDAAGVTIGDTITMDELEDALYAVHAANPDIMPFYFGQGLLNYMYWMESYEAFGNNASYGVILDAATDPTVENLYATDLFKDYCLRMHQWRKDGIIQKDTTDDTDAQSYFSAQQLFCAVINISPSEKITWASDEFETATAMLVEPAITNSTVTEYMWGIAANSERPDKAMDLLNFIYSNTDVANLLLYGLEGVNYDYADGSDTVIVSNGSYDPMFYRGGNTKDMLIKAPADDSYIEQWEAQEASATISPLCGYMFDDANYQTESSVINSTIQEYLPTLQSGLCESEDATLAMIDEFNAKLESSGINDVIAANQEQINAYLEEK